MQVPRQITDAVIMPKSVVAKDNSNNSKSAAFEDLCSAIHYQVNIILKTKSPDAPV